MPKKQDPPITDKDPEDLIAGDSPPDLGQGDDLDEDKLTPPPDIGQVGDKGETELDKLMKAKGFKSPDELAKAYREIEIAKTKLERESQLRSHIPPRPAVGYVPTVFPEQREEEIVIPDDFSDIVYDKNKAKAFLSDFEKRIIQKQENKQKQVERVRMVQEVNQIIAQDPEKFAKLRPIMQQIANDNPHVNDIKIIYKEAERLEQEGRKNLLSIVREDLGIEGLDLEKLKAIAGKVRPAEISTSPGGGVGALNTTEKAEAEKKIKEAILKSDTLEST